MNHRSSLLKAITKLLLLPLFLTTQSLSLALETPQEESIANPDLDAQEQQFEETFNAVLTMEEAEPLHRLQAWGQVISSAVVLDRARALAEGASPDAPMAPGRSEAVTERVLTRWQEARPDDPGPELFRAFRIQNPTEKRRAILSLYERYPDDPLMVQQAAQQLSAVGGAGTDQATEILRAFVDRQPRLSIAYRQLANHLSRLDNKTQSIELLHRWAAALPADPEMVSHWMSSPLPQQEIEATHRTLGEFFSSAPDTERAYAACRSVARHPKNDHAPAGMDCLARIAQNPETSPGILEAAASTLAELATLHGDTSQMAAARDAAAPESELLVTLGTARGMAVPQQCRERLEMLSSTAESLPADGSLHHSVASLLWECRERSLAQSLFLQLLGSVPLDQLGSVFRPWAAKVNEIWTGELPTGTAALLEQRLARNPDTADLFRLLDVAYQLEDLPGGDSSEQADSDSRRLNLLRRWQLGSPTTFRDDQAEALAWEYLAQDDTQSAIKVLEKQVGSHPNPDIVDLLWELYLESGGPGRGAVFTESLLASSQPLQVVQGHLLAARTAALEEDLGSATAHYRQALQGERPSREVALELLAVASDLGDSTHLVELSQWICRQTGVGSTSRDGRPGDPETCSAQLLAESGNTDAAASVLEGQDFDRINDLRVLQERANTARLSGRPDLAEAALRRIIAIDPRDPNGWVKLGNLLEQEGDIQGLEGLLTEARRLFSPLPSTLLRAAGRANTKAGQPLRAIELLKEARENLPEGASSGWIDAELRDAYRVLGQLSKATPPAPPTPAPESTRGAVGSLTSRASSPLARASQVLLASLTMSQEAPAGGSDKGSGNDLLTQAEALHNGSGGRYDREAAEALFRQAAATGNPAAEFRLALVLWLKRSDTAASRQQAEQLLRRSSRIVEGEARAGDSYAQYMLGTAALIGLGGSVSYPEAQRWLSLAAEQDQDWAWHNLAWMKEMGHGLSQPDPKGALEAYQRASRLGNRGSAYDAGRLALAPERSGKICQDGIADLERGAQAGIPRAAAMLGKYLYYGLGDCVSQQPQRALPWLEKAFLVDAEGAGYDLALALFVGDAGKSDRQRAIRLFEKEARGNAVIAMETLGFLLAAGHGVERDVSRSQELQARANRLGSDGWQKLCWQADEFPPIWDLVEPALERLEALAAKKDPAASGFLSQLYGIGRCVPLDHEKSFRLAKIGAEKGDAKAMRFLASAYRMGQGVEQDKPEGLRWLGRCAEAGNSFCMMHYSQHLMKGTEIDFDLPSALQWLTRSAEAGNWWAMVDLGNLYDEGWNDLPRDPAKAAQWKKELAALGHAESRGWLLANGYSLP